MKILGILLLDSFRMLRSQKLFWVVLFLSGIVAVLYASIGFNEIGVTLLFGLFSWENELVRKGSGVEEIFYVLLFTNFIVPYWLSLVAVVLALISCASIFPEFVKSGSVDLFLSKPPTRLTLFVGKYVGSLLFVFAQVLLFSLIVFLSVGFRLGEWSLSIFWAVPIVVFIFSLIYAVHVLVSVWSGSVVFGLLAAFFVWGMGVLMEWTEDVIYQFVYAMPQLGMEMDFQGGEVREGEAREDAGETGVAIHRAAKIARLPLPKTRVAANQLNRLVRVGGDDLTGEDPMALMLGVKPKERETEVMERYQKRHSLAVDLASSLAFELVVVGFAAFVFCRRDY